MNKSTIDNMFGYFFPEKTSGRFYVYILFRPDGRPFYVGKGCGDRLGAHEREARRGCECHKCRVIRKIWRESGEVDRQIVFCTDNELTAFRYEAQLIQRFKSKLVNIQDADPRVWRFVKQPKLRISKELRRRQRMQRATDQINYLNHKIGLAIRYKREHQIERLEAEIEAYRLWIHPPIQLRLEGF